jgi:hypothetical protein
MFSPRYQKSLLLLLLCSSLPAYAYIDPGSGSLLIQAIVGAIAAVGVTLKLYWHKLKVFFSQDTVEKDKPSRDINPDSET